MSLSKEDFILEVAAFKKFLSGGDNSGSLDRLKKNVLEAMDKELTPTQKETVLMYYYQNKTIPEIANIKGVNKSGISRILKRARARLLKVLKYSV